MKKIKKLKAHLAGKGLSRNEITHRIIRVLLMLNGLTDADLARKIGLSRPAVTYVVIGSRKTPATRKFIAEILDVDYQELWGGNDRGQGGNFTISLSTLRLLYPLNGIWQRSCLVFCICTGGKHVKKTPSRISRGNLSHQPQRKSPGVDLPSPRSSVMTIDRVKNCQIPDPLFLRCSDYGQSAAALSQTRGKDGALP